MSSCFRREKKKFTWDWHAWNLALVSTPSLLLAYYLHGVEKQMYEEAAIREEIQERTGVSSRGFLIPKKEVRDEVLSKLSAGNQRGIATSGKDGQAEVRRDDAALNLDGCSCLDGCRSIVYHPLPLWCLRCGGNIGCSLRFRGRGTPAVPIGFLGQQQYGCRVCVCCAYFCSGRSLRLGK